jgi:Family of unknown function (DUF5996)
MESNINAAQNTSESDRVALWPALPYEEWRDTCQTLHVWTQIVGKVRMELSPFLNHWWHVTLYVTTRGLTTSAIPYHGRTFDVTFDFLEHNLFVRTNEGTTKVLPLIPRSVAAFYREFMDCLQTLGIQVTINTLPSEVQNPIRCDIDEVHASYDPLYAKRFWRILTQTATVMERYRSPFVGKSSPVHFFWGSFDLAVTLFSGRRAPERPGADRMMREAMSHEEISCGFWPGNDSFPTPVFYAFTSPEPPGLSTASIRPATAFYSQQMGEFLLHYDDVRSASSPEQALLAFFQSTYEAGATLGKWDREALERNPFEHKPHETTQR